MSYPRVCNILDFPDEILVKIVLHLDPIKRLALASSCQRFNNLVFRDEELLRNLDFTGRRQLTRASDIRQYFNDEDTCEKILRINIENVMASISLKSSICKAINLVELNILNGLQLVSVEEFACFLKPLVHLKRLSVNWPDPYMLEDYYNHNWTQVLKKPFSRLTYLSLEIGLYTTEFLLILQLCQQLEELHLAVSGDRPYYASSLRQAPVKLSNLKIVRLNAGTDLGLLWGYIMCIVQDPAEWTDFHPDHLSSELYLEKNLEVCPELSRVKEMPPPQDVRYYRETSFINKDWPLVPIHLLREVMRVTHEDVPKKFCCMSSSGFSSSQPCRLKINETKKLLKDPEYQISHLHLSHFIEKNSDVHLLASAFPNLTKLVLTGISNRYSMSETTEPLYRRLKKKESLSYEDEYSDATNTDSSFKMLIENTPCLKVLDIFPDPWEEELQDWDLDALYLISGWKNLTVIRLCDIPITDGKFLIDIGKECQKLEEVMLFDLSPDNNCSYESELLQMLEHCKNLRKLSIMGLNLELRLRCLIYVQTVQDSQLFVYRLLTKRVILLS